MADQWGFVLAAYGVTWVVLIGYGVYVARRWRRVRDQVDGGAR